MPDFNKWENPSFAGLLWRSAVRWPDRPAILEEAGEATFGQLQAQAAGFASRLREMGTMPGEPVCILMHRGAASAAAFFGVLAAGGVACMVNEAYRPRQVRYVLGHTAARVVIADATLWAPLESEFAGAVTRLDPEAVVPATFDPVPRMADEPGQIVYTSGSTGKPKGVVTSHANLWSGAEVVPKYLGLGPEDRIASLLPFSFVYGFNQLVCALATGGMLVVERATLPRDIVTGLRAGRITVLAGVPPLWMQLLPSLTESPLPDLRVATCAGGRLAPDLVRRLRAAQPSTSLFLMYGLTEVFRSTFLPPDEVDAHPDSMGRAVPGSEVMVIRDDGARCAAGEVGELVHRGPTVALGYWRDPEGTATVFRANPFPHAQAGIGERVVYSGDLVRLDDSGLLYYVGRRDRMIKTLGYRVSPEEVSDTLLASGMATEAVVCGEPDAQRGERIVAHVCLAPGHSLAALRQFCGVELPRYMQPTRYQLHESLPRNAAGKVDLSALQSAPPAS